MEGKRRHTEFLRNDPSKPFFCLSQVDALLLAWGCSGAMPWGVKSSDQSRCHPEVTWGIHKQQTGAMNTTQCSHTCAKMAPMKAAFRGRICCKNS
jgi:hypothetical protein